MTKQIAAFNNNSLAVRCRIEGNYKGKPFTYEDPPGWESQFLHIDEDGNVDPSTYWWTEGNFSCDCNRCEFLPEGTDHDGSCGNEIKIHKIIPLIDGAPPEWTLELNR